MKQYFFLLAAAILIISSSSCQKDYTCQCVNNYGQKSAFTIHDTKGKAKKICDSYNVGVQGQPHSNICKQL